MAKNKKIEKCSLSLITRLPQICKPNEFMVAFFIINTMSLEKQDRVKMYRGELADLCNMSERNITRLTDSLSQIGIVQKELIGDEEKKKTFNYYRLNWEKTDEILARFDNESSSSVPELSGLKNQRIQESKNTRTEEPKNQRIQESKNTRTEEQQETKNTTTTTNLLDTVFLNPEDYEEDNSYVEDLNKRICYARWDAEEKDFEEFIDESSKEHEARLEREIEEACSITDVDDDDDELPF